MSEENTNDTVDLTTEDTAAAEETEVKVDEVVSEQEAVEEPAEEAAQKAVEEPCEDDAEEEEVEPQEVPIPAAPQQKPSVANEAPVEDRPLSRKEMKAAKKAAKLAKKNGDKEIPAMDENTVTVDNPELLKKIEELETELKAKEQELAAALQAAKEAQDRTLEVKVIAANMKNDFDNFRKRNAEANVLAKEDGINKVLTEIIPIIDNFDRARPYITDESSLEGYNMMEGVFISTLAKFGVEEIEALDRDFDANFMNAVARVEDPEHAGKVIDVLSKGFKKGDKVLRYAVVRIAY